MATTTAAAPPHAPERGRLARLLGPLHVTGVFWYRVHAWAVRRMPAWTIAPLVHLFTWFFFCTLWRIRRAVASNLVPVLGPAGFLEAQQRIHRTLLTYAWCLTERWEHLCGVGDFAVETEGLDSWHAISGRSGGFVVQTAHVGVWEPAAGLLARVGERQVHLVREEELDPEAQRFVRELVERRGGATLTTHFAGNPLLGMVLREALTRGELVALQGDRPRAEGRTVAARLFGRAFRLPVGPLALARSAAVPLLPVFALREGRRRYRVLFLAPISVPASAERQGDLIPAAAAVAAGLETVIRRVPFQWFCFREVWAAGAAGTSSGGAAR
ncbi:MAG: hypothetical protein ACRD0X_05175 [Thermoanaerobaculia bacterium]